MIQAVYSGMLSTCCQAEWDMQGCTTIWGHILVAPVPARAFRVVESSSLARLESAHGFVALDGRHRTARLTNWGHAEPKPELLAPLSDDTHATDTKVGWC
jgi:hypothetical protein